jgi:hypothetical protein
VRSGDRIGNVGDQAYEFQGGFGTQISSGRADVLVRDLWDEGKTFFFSTEGCAC